ncbi:G-protein coupled receptor Mth2-like [Stegodyphus dumicola]|uniref:G-protein coupled receptor Mth2-like n=1 Tax=Stegodyphus dumicola TaxID=202533 RepID=UPI0015AA74AD|nr:G-protein coupled receptor Mth2-like [Stegodyphus dumicola]XP_035226088.1 G-protein coupled receptor Mth2-like [Stegodyphus dumicola]XP_035226096.1 G-protein coupled receptor Mth2-like [Stegodyphus dumicola]XP_035226103.1 G-protein coupled receptor Mth2-like [Stegodyphus dumicola]XP_035226110.1 G-protein coupled receptor Mth2-like [Stegodyphus dumicola]
MNEIFFLTFHIIFLASLSQAVNETVKEDGELFQGKHPSLYNCPVFDLNPKFYTIFPNGTLYIESINTTYNESLYILQDNVVYISSGCENETVNVTENEGIKEEEFEGPLKYLSQIGLGISVVCLLLHLLVFALVPLLRNLPGYNLASLCLSLFIGYLFTMITDDENLNKNNRNLCIASAVLIQYFFIASFLWMSGIAFNIYRSLLQATGSLRICHIEFTLKKYGFYCVFSWGISMVFAAAALIADNVSDFPELYQPRFERTCWFFHKESNLVFFVGPIFSLIIFNLIIFVISAYIIFSNRMKYVDSNNKMLLKKHALIYFRLFVIMGVTWIVKLLAAVMNALWLWYISTVLNTFQGLFIFLAFTCRRKVKNHLVTRVFGSWKKSQPALKPTFQSYCFYENSIKMDLHKTADIGKENISMDTVVMHI